MDTENKLSSESYSRRLSNSNSESSLNKNQSVTKDGRDIAAISTSPACDYLKYSALSGCFSTLAGVAFGVGCKTLGGGCGVGWGICIITSAGVGCKHYLEQESKDGAESSKEDWQSSSASLVLNQPKSSNKVNNNNKE